MVITSKLILEKGISILREEQDYRINVIDKIGRSKQNKFVCYFIMSYVIFCMILSVIMISFWAFIASLPNPGEMIFDYDIFMYITFAMAVICLPSISSLSVWHALSVRPRKNTKVITWTFSSMGSYLIARFAIFDEDDVNKYYDQFLSIRFYIKYLENIQYEEPCQNKKYQFKKLYKTLNIVDKLVHVFILGGIFTEIITFATIILLNK